MDRSHGYMRDKDIGYGRVQPIGKLLQAMRTDPDTVQVLARDDTIQPYQDALKAYSL